MPSKSFLINKLLSILNDSLRPLKMVTVLLSIASIVSIIAYDDIDITHFYFLLEVLPKAVWIFLFAVHGTTRLISLFYEGIFSKIKLAHFIPPTIAIWLWTMIMIGTLTVAMTANFTVLICLVVIIIEVWILGRSITDRVHHDK